MVGPTTYRLLKSLLAPAKSGEKTYDELVAKLTTHYAPTPSETVQRHKFHTRVRREGETVATFVSELRSIATFCNFGDNLEQMLRDRLICGINNEMIQNRLLAEAKLDLRKPWSSPKVSKKPRNMLRSSNLGQGPKMKCTR